MKETILSQRVEETKTVAVSYACPRCGVSSNRQAHLLVNYSLSTAYENHYKCCDWKCEIKYFNPTTKVVEPYTYNSY